METYLVRLLCEVNDSVCVCVCVCVEQGLAYGKCYSAVCKYYYSCCNWTFQLCEPVNSILYLSLRSLTKLISHHVGGRS